MNENLYRKYRPTNFNEVVGQEIIKKTLLNSIKNDRIAHAYLFNGIRGTGKTSIAKILAKSINCENYENPLSPDCNCNTCISTLTKSDNEITDIFEIDAASNNGVDEIRKIIDSVKFMPISLKYKVYIIDEVHMLSKGAFNALLKTLEEPPKHAVFILATTEPNKIPVTILSRCQRFDFSRINNNEMKEHLINILTKENLEFDKKAIDILIKHAQGSLRDLLSLATKVISYNNTLNYSDTTTSLKIPNNDHLIKLADAILNSDIDLLSATYNKLIASGSDEGYLITELIYLFKDGELNCSKQSTYTIIKRLSLIESDLKLVKNPALLLEVELIDISFALNSTNNTLNHANPTDEGNDNKEHNFDNNDLSSVDFEVNEVHENFTPLEENELDVVLPFNETHETTLPIDNPKEQYTASPTKATSSSTAPTITSFDKQDIIDTLKVATKKDKNDFTKHFNSISQKLKQNNKFGIANFFEIANIEGACSESLVVTINEQYHESSLKRLEEISMHIKEQVNKDIHVHLLTEETWKNNRANYVQIIKDLKNNDIYQKAVDIFGDDITTKK